jgi:hypothetical protein
MAEWRFFEEGEIPYVSTAAFHAHRPRAPHLEQEAHRPRLEAAADLVRFAAGVLHAAGRAEVGVADLCCGDGGLLSLLKPGGRWAVPLRAWGYDFQPSNAAGWAERGVDARLLDVFGPGRAQVRFGEIAVCTEALEHLADPHGAVRWIGGRSPFLVASSPWGEHPGSRDPCHAWAWDWDGYAALLAGGGYRLTAHMAVGPFQVALGVRDDVFPAAAPRAGDPAAAGARP